jgi:hypothetical protein
MAVRFGAAGSAPDSVPRGRWCPVETLVATAATPSNCGDALKPQLPSLHREVLVAGLAARVRSQP